MANVRHILDNNLHVPLSDEGLILRQNLHLVLATGKKCTPILMTTTGDIAINIGSLQLILTMLQLYTTNSTQSLDHNTFTHYYNKLDRPFSLLWNRFWIDAN